MKSETKAIKMDMLNSILTRVIISNSETGNVGLLFSGGIDSSVLAKILLNNIDKDKIFFVSVGKEGSPDIKNASAGASLLGFNPYFEFITEENFEDSIKKLKKMKTIKNPGDLTIAIPLYLGMRCLSLKAHVNTIFLGQGADEIFGGYFKYELLVEQGRREDVIEKMESDLKKLKECQLLMEREIAAEFGVKLVYPYLEDDAIDLAMSLPFELYFENKFGNKITRKVFLRAFAKYINLPDHFVKKEKKAMQYGSGSVKMLRLYTNQKGYRTIKNWFYSEFRAKP